MYCIYSYLHYVILFATSTINPIVRIILLNVLLIDYRYALILHKMYLSCKKVENLELL